MNKEIIKELYKRYAKKGYLNEEEVKGKKRFVERSKKGYKLKDRYRRMIKVYATGGVFEVLHIGHIRMLKGIRRIAKDGVVVVVVAHDNNIIKKGREVLFNQRQRAEVVEAIRYVDVVVKGLRDINKVTEWLEPDVVVYGYDQERIKVKWNNEVKEIRIRRFGDAKTSKILKDIRKDI